MQLDVEELALNDDMTSHRRVWRLYISVDG